MTNQELINWCDEKGYPMKVAALLSTFTPNTKELDEWDISYNKYCEVIINDSVYNVYTESERIETIESYQNAIQDDMSYNIPEFIQNYINWESFWNDNPVDLEEITGYYSNEIDFDDNDYYICEL